MARDRLSHSHRRVYSGRVDRRGASRQRDSNGLYNNSLNYAVPTNSRLPRNTAGTDRSSPAHAAHRTLPSQSSQNVAISYEPEDTGGPIRGYTSMPYIGTNVTDRCAGPNTHLHGITNADMSSAHTASGNANVVTDNSMSRGNYHGSVDTSNIVMQQRAEITALPDEPSNEADYGGAIQRVGCCTQQPGHQEEINYHNSHHEINLTLQTHDISSSYDSPPPIPDVISGYTITELPRPVEQTSRHQQQILMMDGTDVSGLNNNRPEDCAAIRSQCFDRTQGITNIIDCLPPPFYYPSSRRTRRHRRRRRRRRASHHRRRHSHTARQEEERGYVKPDCCSMLSCKICLAGCLQFKRVLVSFASFGVVCILIGIVLGVLRAPGNSFFTLSLMFVGLGLILLTMVLVGWKCTPSDHEPCHMLFGLGSYCALTRRDRRRRERLFWFGNPLYPEFRYRAPPPSYAAAMQDFRNEMRQREPIAYVPGSPPPSYKSHRTIERPGVHIIFPRNEEFPGSNPPTYRLRTQATRPSLAILNDSNLIGGAELPPPNRFSVSSTAELVESEQSILPQTPGGVVNLSFSDSDRNLELSQYDVEGNSRNTSNIATDRVAQTDGNIHRLNNRNVVITLEAEGPDSASFL